MRKTLKNLKEKDDILSKSTNIANKPDIINATIGTLYDENHNIAILNDVNNVRLNLTNKEVYAYSSTLGINGFKEALISFLWQDYQKSFLKKKHIEILPTPGATGALNLALYLALNPKETVLLPKICWNVYFQMARELDLKVVTYSYLKDDHFALKDFKEKVEKISKYQKHIVTILNDPCNNPTGYSLKDEEFISLIKYINSKKDLKFTFIYDVAYYEYGLDFAAKRFNMLQKFNKNVLVLLTWSASKAFTMYGLRFGSLIFIDSSKRKTKDLLTKAKIIARGRFSCVSSEASNIIYQILTNKDLLLSYRQNLNEFKEVLFKRAILFSLQAKEVNLPIVPYFGGFFIAVKTNNVTSLCEELEKNNIYVIPGYHLVRIAICSLSLKQCDGLAYTIKKCLDKLT